MSDAKVGLRASGFINLLLGGAYLEAALGLDNPERDAKFEQQIAQAVRFAIANIAGPEAAAWS
ncbi:MAG: hypothetical protein WC729_08885 [Sphingomonas sp.]|uniref:hypothetical protein n=1 Tax=Sphingomonas sp. TaxID=28214 RepID=UPI003563D994